MTGISKKIFNSIKHSSLCIVAGAGVLFAASLASCSETDETDAKYSDWQKRNDAFITGIFNQAKDSIRANNPNWKIFKALSKDDSVSIKAADHIIVKVLNEGKGTVSPVQNDSVKVHYKGYLINTDYVSSAQVASDYTYGTAFDYSWTGQYNLSTMVPAKFKVSSLTEGFATALQHMHAGDRWLVYIPNELAYASSEQGSVLPYSTLVFDMTLQAFSKPGVAMK